MLGSSTNAWASESGLSSTMAMSILHLFKIATALFSHTFRSHSSTVLGLALLFVPGQSESLVPSCFWCGLAFAVFLQWNRDGGWTVHRSHTSSLLWPTNGGHLYALIS